MTKGLAFKILKYFELTNLSNTINKPTKIIANNEMVGCNESLGGLQLKYKKAMACALGTRAIFY